MALKAGSIFKRVKLKDGTVAVLRAPKWEDVDEFLAFINGLIDEGDLYIGVQTKPTWEEELDWHANGLARVEKGEAVVCVAEVAEHVVGNSSVTKKSGIQSHVGELGISVHKDYRDSGLGTEIMKVLIEEACKIELKIVLLNVFSGNDRAIHVYEKVGFKEVGRIPKAIFKWGQYLDEIIMAIEL
jgi:RimJ/RimL family protein N-acetyltransferase